VPLGEDLPSVIDHRKRRKKKKKDPRDVSTPSEIASWAKDDTWESTEEDEEDGDMDMSISREELGGVLVESNRKDGWFVSKHGNDVTTVKKQTVRWESMEQEVSEANDSRDYASGSKSSDMDREMVNPERQKTRFDSCTKDRGIAGKGKTASFSTTMVTCRRCGLDSGRCMRCSTCNSYYCYQCRRLSILKNGCSIGGGAHVYVECTDTPTSGGTHPSRDSFFGRISSPMTLQLSSNEMSGLRDYEKVACMEAGVEEEEELLERRPTPPSANPNNQNHCRDKAEQSSETNTSCEGVIDKYKIQEEKKGGSAMTLFPRDAIPILPRTSSLFTSILTSSGNRSGRKDGRHGEKVFFIFYFSVSILLLSVRGGSSFDTLVF
tara:strand:+ start:858 stop:1991 length:1134 start_codon:yes stop_codon:yes gene_type:complete